MKIKPSEVRAIRREYAAYQAQHSDTSNAAYFRRHAHEYGCDPNSKGQCRVFCQYLDAAAKDWKAVLLDGVGMMPTAFFLAKHRYPTPAKRQTARKGGAA